MVSESPTFEQEESCGLPQDIVDACREIGKRAYEAADPTKISHVNLPKSLLYRVKKSLEDQVFISLVSRPTFNTAEMLKEEGEFFSVPIDLAKVKGKLTIHEVVADILLQGVLFSKYCDKCFIPENDFHLTEKSGYVPFNTNNFRYSHQSYYTFDFEGEELLEPIEDRAELLEILLRELMWMFGQDTNIISERFLEKDIIGGGFGRRILDKSMELLELYGDEDGKSFFIQQAQKAGIGGCHESLYKNFIHNLNIISKTFKEDEGAIGTYISHDIERAKKELDALEERTRVVKKFLQDNI